MSFSCNNHQIITFVSVLKVFRSFQYTIDFQLIPKQPGIYLMGFNIGFHHSFIIKCCGEEVINEYLNVNNGAHNNYSLLMLSPDTSIQQIPFKVFRESGNFAFQVME